MPISSQIQKFNSEPHLYELRNSYSFPSFFEIAGISRKENNHTSFLRWLFEGKDIVTDRRNTPLMCLLDILVSWDGLQRVVNGSPVVNIPTVLRDAILTRSIRIGNVIVEQEKEIGSFGIIKNSRDRIDLYIKCDIYNVAGINELNIIIENKVGTKEGDEKMNLCKIPSEHENDAQFISLYSKYNSSTQTERYVIGTKSCESGKQFIYVYLTPVSSVKLANYISLDAEEIPSSNEYIQINYQDIADRVITPLLRVKNLPDRISFILKEYLNCLSIPFMEDDKNDETGNVIIMAVPSEDKQNFVDLWTEYRELILKSLFLCNPIEGICPLFERKFQFEECIATAISESDITDLAQKFGKKVVLKNIGKQFPKSHNSILGGDYGVVDVMANNISLNGNKCSFYDIIKDREIFSELKLLMDFYYENQNVILTLVNILASFPDDEYSQLRDIMDALSNTRDYTKYIVLKNHDILNEQLNDQPKGMNKRSVVKSVIQNIGIKLDYVCAAAGKPYCDIFNEEIKPKVVVKRDDGIQVDETRYQCYKWQNGNYVAVNAGEDFDIRITNQWGKGKNNDGSFEKFIEIINRYLPEFTIMTVQDYIADGNC